jgi:phosphatidylserine/phosphatidylglycerophosphate/cardiolipin synthase-like enzyme
LNEALGAVPVRVLRDLARALEGSGLAWPPSVTELRRLGCGDAADEIAGELGHLASEGTPPSAVVWALGLTVAGREQARRAVDRLELVWTGPEQAGSRSRDTAVVVRELLSSAKSSVLVATYAIHQAKQVFEPLGKRMRERPELKVRFFVHVGRAHLDQTPENQILHVFAEGFRRGWPGERLPEVYFDPRSLALRASERRSLHAKCIVVDDRRSFVTSANFTEAAQNRNIEAGVLVDDATLALSLRAQFDALVAQGDLHRLAL